MKKRVMSVILVLSISVLHAGCTNNSQSTSGNSKDETVTASNDEYEYSISDDFIHITKYIGSAADVVIPSEIDGKEVKSLDAMAFTLIDAESVTSVTVPDTVEYIGEGIFTWYNESLASVTLPDSISYLGDNAFERCDKVEVTYKGNIYTASNMDELYAAANEAGGFMVIGDVATECSTVSTDITIGAPATKIKEMLFFESEVITSVVIGDGVTSIGDYAFFCCSNLTEVTLPDSLTHISESAFEGCGQISATYKGKTYTALDLKELCADVNG